MYLISNVHNIMCVCTYCIVCYLQKLRRTNIVRIHKPTAPLGPSHRLARRKKRLFCYVRSDSIPQSYSKVSQITFFCYILWINTNGVCWFITSQETSDSTADGMRDRHNKWEVSLAEQTASHLSYHHFNSDTISCTFIMGRCNRWDDFRVDDPISNHYSGCDMM